jgi:lipopolysaccharide transport system ATP-binding protein
MEEPIIEIKNIGKKYNITHQRGGYVTLRDILANIVRSPFAFLKTKAKQVAGFEKKEEFWALKNVSFNIKRGEVIGIIGANGAGKSTLLKILSQITPPTTGEIILRGRVGSLLEVGTGFHPELTGRENIFLNGAILGMKKKEIARKFDEIVEFAGIEKFLDTPVKYYSSGMYVRLAFSVAAHMEPDILIVDEVLAVGDDKFQKKCLGKMDDIAKKEGRTILFVSHNISAITRLCQRVVLLNKGEIIKDGPSAEVANVYLHF